MGMTVSGFSTDCSQAAVASVRARGPGVLRVMGSRHTRRPAPPRLALLSPGEDLRLLCPRKINHCPNRPLGSGDCRLGAAMSFDHSGTGLRIAVAKGVLVR